MAIDLAALFSGIDETTVGALVETMVLAADADGDFEADERTELAVQIGHVVAGTELASLASGDALKTLVDAAYDVLKRDGRDARLLAVKEHLRDSATRKGALGLAVRVVAADGVIRTSERELLLDLAEALAIDPDEAADLVRELTRGPSTGAGPAATPLAAVAGALDAEPPVSA